MSEADKGKNSAVASSMSFPPGSRHFECWQSCPWSPREISSSSCPAKTSCAINCWPMNAGRAREKIFFSLIKGHRIDLWTLFLLSVSQPANLNRQTCETITEQFMIVAGLFLIQRALVSTDSFAISIRFPPFNDSVAIKISSLINRAPRPCGGELISS